MAMFSSITDSLSAGGVNITVGPNEVMHKRMKGASEKDIVQSGLQYTMERSAKQIISRVHAYDLGLDVRTAAFILACEKVYNTTHQAGFSQKKKLSSLSFFNGMCNFKKSFSYLH